MANKFQNIEYNADSLWNAMEYFAAAWRYLTGIPLVIRPIEDGAENEWDPEEIIQPQLPSQKLKFVPPPEIVKIMRANVTKGILDLNYEKLLQFIDEKCIIGDEYSI